MEYVIVEFPERREVFIANQSQGDNRDPVTGVYRVLMVGDGRHTFHLGGPPNYTPLSQTVVVANTNPIAPLRVVFQPNTFA
jgi:hypothetical protein